MSKYPTKMNVVIAVICCFIVGAASSPAEIEVDSQIEQAAILARNGKVQEAENILLPLLNQKETALEAGHELGLIYYESNDLDKAVTYFKTALAAAFSSPETGTIQTAADLAKNGKADEAEKILLSLFDDETSAARARYELGLIYEKGRKLDSAATMFKNALTVIDNNGAVYMGISSCKKCHLKLHKSWKQTKTAQSFDILKPGVAAEAKTKLKFDPQKDYTKDETCLSCHTTGFGLPGGYKIPVPGDKKSAKQAKENESITCEGCHGPGSKYIPVLKAAKFKKRKYTQRQLCDLGLFKVGGRVCRNCHNRRNPTTDSDYHFDFKQYKEKDTHDHFKLRYRLE